MNNQSNNPNNKLDQQLIRRFLDMANCADVCYAKDGLWIGCLVSSL